MDSPYQRELGIAINAVRLAASISRHVLASTSNLTSASNPNSIQKDDLSPVTVADFAIQAVLTLMLRTAFPADDFIGEESADDLHANPDLLRRVKEEVTHCLKEEARRQPGADQMDEEAFEFIVSQDRICELVDACGTTETGGPDSGKEGRVWVFDPIDGTKTFMKGEQYAINVALLVGGRQILSVVGCPKLALDAVGPIKDDTLDPKGDEGGCILFAVKGYGAYVQPLSDSMLDPNAPPVVRRLPRHADGVALDGLKSVTCWDKIDSGVDEVHKAATEALGASFPGTDLLGWVPRWVSLAMGYGNMSVWVYKKRERHGKIWDHAGAMLLFEEVGGMITDVDGREIDLSAGRKLVRNFGFVAAPRSLHHVVLKTLRDKMREEGKEALLASST